MLRKLSSLSLTALMLLTPLASVRAGDCYADPVYQYDQSATIASAVFVRNKACMDGSSVLLTAPKSGVIKVIGYTDGWYFIEYNGGRGWVGQQFVSVSTGNEIKTWSYDEFAVAYPSRAASTNPPPTGTDPNLVSRLKGYILLDVQNHGEAWYIHPMDSKRYYMKDGATAYQMMRSFGLGMTESDYAKLATDTTMKNRLRGRIVLRVEAHGEAYYIHPKDLKVHYLKNGEEAYTVMRLYSLGITPDDLSRISSNEVPVR
ncbi:MAG: SH3 domain-containing protein [Patescibacteria group bacterium]|jgi:hypothetical protein